MMPGHGRANAWRLVLALMLLPLSGHGQTLTGSPPGLASLGERWDWGNRQAVAAGDAWLVYQFSVTLDEKLGVAVASGNDNYIEWNNARRFYWNGFRYNGNNDDWRNGHSLAALQAGNNRFQDNHQRTRELLLMARYHDRAVAELRLVPAATVLNWNSLPVFWLGQVSQQQSLEHLLNTFSAAYVPAIQRALIRAIGLHDGSARDSFLVSQIDNNGAPNLRAAALESLAQRESGAIEARLQRVAADENEELLLRRIAISALSRYDGDTTLELLLALASPLNPGAVRREAVESLALFDDDDATTMLRIIVQQETGLELVGEALRGLTLRPGEFDTVAELAQSGSNGAIREIALNRLVTMDARRAYPVLRRIIEDDSSQDVREEAIEALEDVPAELALPFLLQLAEARGEYAIDLRREAVQALAEFDAPLVMERLNLLAWSDADEDIRDEAVASLAELRTGAANNLLLEIARNHPSNHTRSEALEELQDNLL